MRVKAIIILLTAISICSFYRISSSYAESDRCYGLFLGGKIDTATINEKAKLYAVKPCVIMVFWGWNDYPFDMKLLQNIWDAGAVPMITLEPWYAKNKKGVSLINISSGKEAEILVRFGNLIKEFGHPVFVRFAHEMNGNWYPWSGEKNNRENRSYVDAYRHVYKVVKKAAGGVPIIWVWSINREDVPGKDWNRASNYYPGNEYVDAVGIDGYNWGDTQKWSSWMSFDRLFEKQYNIIKRSYPAKPILITEMASALSGGDRSVWIKNLFNDLGNKYSSIPLFIWFDIKKEANWSISGDNRSLKSFKQGLSRQFKGTRKQLLNIFNY